MKCIPIKRRIKKLAIQIGKMALRQVYTEVFQGMSVICPIYLTERTSSLPMAS